MGPFGEPTPRLTQSIIAQAWLLRIKLLMYGRARSQSRHISPPSTNPHCRALVSKHRLEMTFGPAVRIARRTVSRIWSLYLTVHGGFQSQGRVPFRVQQSCLLRAPWTACGNHDRHGPGLTGPNGRKGIPVRRVPTVLRALTGVEPERDHPGRAAPCAGSCGRCVPWASRASAAERGGAH